MKLLIPPPIYMIGLAIIMWLTAKFLPDLNIISNKINIIGLIIVVVSWGFDLWSLFLFFKTKTTVNPTKPEQTQSLVTKGMYKVSRNPMYLGLLVTLIGVAIFLGNILNFLLLPIFVILITNFQIKPEEEILQKKFGQTYIDYKNKVRRWI